MTQFWSSLSYTCTKITVYNICAWISSYNSEQIFVSRQYSDYLWFVSYHKYLACHSNRDCEGWQDLSLSLAGSPGLTALNNGGDGGAEPVLNRFGIKLEQPGGPGGAGGSSVGYK